MSTVPCLCVGHLSAAEKRAYVLADNKLALNAGWDEELLGLELKELMESDIEFDVGLTGFFGLGWIQRGAFDTKAIHDGSGGAIKAACAPAPQR